MTDLLRAILERPYDDALRLILADWLEERGEAERADFIRVQVALAQLDRCLCVLDPESRKVKIVCRSCNLRRREKKLLKNEFSGEANIWKWMGPALQLVTSPGGIEDNASAYRDDMGHRVLFSRGFVGSVSCRLGDWIGRECWKCRDPDSAISSAASRSAPHATASAASVPTARRLSPLSR